MDQAQQSLDKMSVTAPMDGLISIQKNMDAMGGLIMGGVSMPAYHEGDQVQAGRAIAEVVDPNGLDLTAKIGEQDRSNVQLGQPVNVTFDALPGVAFHGSVKNVAGMSARGFFSSSSNGTFDVSVQLDKQDPRLRSGLTAQLVFLGENKKNVLYLPRLAIFLKDGKRIVYVKKGNGYEQREIKIQSQNDSRAAIDGLDEGVKVALVDPTAPRKSNESATSKSIGGAS
jgi:HlyD family secretion protein